MTSPTFDLFVGIDWSGAKGRWQRGIALAVCGPDGACRLVRPPTGRSWSRAAVLAWLVDAPSRTLAGLDFAFSLPWPDDGPLPPGLDQPVGTRELWLAIEEVCRSEPDFHAGSVYRPEGGWLASYMFTKLTGHPLWSGDAYDSNRLREVESMMRPRPNAAFKIVGAKTVGPGSFSGMRVLAALARTRDRVAIWPFGRPMQDALTVVEIYPTYYFGCAGHRRSRDPAIVASVLAHFDAGCDEPSRGVSQDEADALVSAAALRHFASRPGSFCDPGGRSKREGWIFGVPAPNGDDR